MDRGRESDRDRSKTSTTSRICLGMKLEPSEENESVRALTEANLLRKENTHFQRKLGPAVNRELPH
jgi:hypothetical protein